jgi:phosphate starvation-inducible protein PhoH
MSCVNDILNFEGAEDIGFYKFNNDDICRAEIVKTVLEVYKQHEEKNA